jgi:hypothetical protein
VSVSPDLDVFPEAHVSRRALLCCPVAARLLSLAALALASFGPLVPNAHAQTTCATAMNTTIGVDVQGNNAASPGDGLNDLCAPTSKSVWHSFSPTVSGTYTISLCSSSFNTVATLYGSCAQPLLACDDDTCADDAVIVYPLAAGSTYFLRVASFGNTSGGAYTLRILPPGASAPAYDICGTARTLTLNVPEALSTSGASGTDISPCGTLDTADVWCSFNASITGTYLVQVCSNVFQPVVSAHASCFSSSSTGCDSGTQLLPCNDAGVGAALAMNVTTTGPQRLRIAGTRGSFGPFTIVVYAPRSNDLCSNPVPITFGVPTAGSTTPALTTDAIACAPSGYDVWHSFTPINTGLYRVSTCGSAPGTTFDSIVSVYTSCPSNPNAAALGCSATSCSAEPGSSLDVALNGGQTYFVRVAGKGSPASFGDYTINTALIAPPNDDCASAIALNENTVAFGNSTGATGVDLTSCAVNDTRDVWYRFTPQASAIYEFNTCTASFDTSLALLDSCSGSVFACTGTTPGYCGVSSSGSALTASLSAGVPVLVRVAGIAGGQGAFQLTVSRTPAANDHCASALAITEGVIAASTTTGASGSGFSSCAQPDNADVWFSFVPNTTRFYRFSTCGSVMPGVLSVYTSCPPGVELACSGTQASECASGVQATALLQAGSSYRIRVARTSAALGGSVRLLVEGATPLNDSCAGAQTINLDTPTLGSNIASNSDVSQSCAVSDGSDVFFVFTPALTGHYQFDTCGAGALDTVVSVHSACASGAIGCNDDGSGCTFGRSRLIARLTGGQSYLVRVAGRVSAQGWFTLNASVASPPNDTCATATSIGEGTFPFDTLNAGTDNAFLDAACANALGFNLLVGDVWFRYTPSRSGLATISTCGSTFDTAMAVSSTSGGCPSGVYTVLACNDDAVCPPNTGVLTAQSRLSLNVSSGQSYFIRIGSRFGNVGSGALAVSIPGGCPCDFDTSGAVNIDDIFIFLNAWFAQDPRTDFDHNGSRNIDDIFQFINCFFNQPAGC